MDKLQHEFKVIKETTSHIRADVVLQEEKICNLEKQQKSDNILWEKKYDKIHEEITSKENRGENFGKQMNYSVDLNKKKLNLWKNN